MAQASALPMLRSDLALHPGPALPGGEQSWTLFDPASNRFFRIGWLEFEVLRRFNLAKTVADLCDLLRRETVLRVEPDDIEHLSKFLVQNDLIVQTQRASTKRFTAMNDKRRKPLWERALHGYLFFTVPILRPQRFLKALMPYAAPLLTQQFFMAMMALLAFGVMLTAQRWDEFVHTAIASFTLQGLAAGALAFIGVKMVHEMAHALMATKYGVRVASMGVAVMVLYPVLYTETSGAWKLTRKKPRLLIGGAGMLAELCLAAIALLVWHIVPDGGVKSAAFFVAFISLAGTLAVNLNPLMRFDGYFLLSDALGMDNLQQRGFALARWNLRRILFGWNDEPPEYLAPALHRTTLIYSYATWVYRFFLFLGIALLVYHLFFPPLGLALMMVELGWFIGLPILSELKVWNERREHITWNRNTKRLAWLGGACFLLLIFPWSGRITSPAMLVATKHEMLYPPAPAFVADIRVKDNELVKAGETLAVLQSPALEQELALARMERDKLEAQYRSERVSPALIGRTAVLESQARQAQEKLDGLERRAEALSIKAPFDGRVRDILPYLHTGRWLGMDAPLMRVVANGEWQVMGYMRGADLKRLPGGATGKFYSDTGAIAPLKVRVVSVQKTNAASIDWPALAGINGGSLDTQPPPPDAPHALVPRESLYAVTMSVEPGNAAPPEQALAGQAEIRGARQSALLTFLKQAAALVIRESGL